VSTCPTCGKAVLTEWPHRHDPLTGRRRPAAGRGGRVSEPICLNDEEVAALRRVLAMLATIGERGFRDDDQLCQISAQMWKYELVIPAQPLVRRLAMRLDSGQQREGA